MLRKLPSFFYYLLDLVSKQSLAQPTALVQQPLPADCEAWRTYWNVRNQPWRTEPEIDKERQEKLARYRSIVPDPKKGIYSFRGVKLNRADIEWLLATHENGRGPVDWSDKSQRDRKGIDLRGADLRGADLQRLPLARTLAGYDRTEWLQATSEQGVSVLFEMDGAINVHLEKANLSFTHLEGAILALAHLEGANLYEAHLEGTDLHRTHLEGTYLYKTNLGGTSLRNAFFDNSSVFQYVLFKDEWFGSVLLADTHWGDMNLSLVNWRQLEILGDEYEARRSKRLDGKTKDRDNWIRDYRRAVRSYRQLATILREQGLNEEAARFSYRAQLLQRKVRWFQMFQRGIKLRQRVQILSGWLFSWFLFLLAGYGYRMGRSFLAYLLVISLFTALYRFVDPHLVWSGAFVVSMTAFHGRGFSPSSFLPGDPLSIISAIEAFVGLIIEVTFIATLTQRFFNR